MGFIPAADSVSQRVAGLLAHRGGPGLIDGTDLDAVHGQNAVPLLGTRFLGGSAAADPLDDDFVPFAFQLPADDGPPPLEHDDRIAPLARIALFTRPQ